MMSCLSLQSPFVVATLPRPVNQTTGRYVCAEVHGSTPGSRKRKRELAVGIDGEGVNLYDTATSKLITSYALPPQSFFTCSPCATKSQVSRKTGFERRTYTSTIDSTSRISLFRDVVAVDGSTASSIVKKESQITDNTVVFIDTISQLEECNLLVVHKDGQIHCLDGNTLELRWSSTAGAIEKTAMVHIGSSTTIEFCQVADAHSTSQGLFQDRPDVLSSFPEPISSEGYNPDLLIVISQSAQDLSRILHVIALPKASNSGLQGASRSVHSVLSLKLPKNQLMDGPLKYELHGASGMLYAASNCGFQIYNLTGSLPKLQTQITLGGEVSLLRLSSASLAVAHADRLDVYNPAFGSIQASTSLSGGQATIGKRKLEEITSDVVPCRLFSYSKSQGLIHGIRDNELVAFQIEANTDSQGKSRSLGLLIDSIGLGRQATSIQHQLDQQQKFSELDRHALSGNVEAFEEIMAEVFGMQRGKIPVDNHDVFDGVTSEQTFKSVPEWIWPASPRMYNSVDPSWLRYALSKIFTWEKATSNAQSAAQLRLVFYPHNVVRWLIESGNLNRANVESALRQELLASRCSGIPAGQLVAALAEADPAMNALLSLLSNTYLDAAEIVHSIRFLMSSLELFGDNASHPKGLLTNGDAAMTNGNVEEEIEEEEEAANDELQLAEFHLGDGSSVRGQALSVAVAKLHAAPTQTVVQALKSTLSSADIMALIYLLRFELARGSWTSRYLDVNQLEDETTEPQNSNVVLVTDLLNNCIDAIGSGGWLGGEATLASGDQSESEELVTSLKLEVSAALEGIEEAAYLRGLTAEMIRYGEAIQSTTHQSSNGRSKKERPIILPQAGKDTALLPFGLKPVQQISKQKVGAGGEVTRRTARDIGRLKSRKVGKYSRERITI